MREPVKRGNDTGEERQQKILRTLTLNGSNHFKFQKYVIIFCNNTFCKPWEMGKDQIKKITLFS